ncbi:hypothetical protein BH18THE2_BH18THE2_09180 [soil metagenome]
MLHGKYTQDYQLFKQGENELTAKISCYDDGEFDLNPFPASVGTTSSISPLSEWHTVNVTAVQGAAVPSPSPSPSNTQEVGEVETGNDEEESAEESSDDDGSNADSTGDDSNSLFD